MLYRYTIYNRSRGGANNRGRKGRSGPIQEQQFGAYAKKQKLYTGDTRYRIQDTGAVRWAYCSEHWSRHC